MVMEHHSSYSAPRSSRGSEHTRPAASRPSQRRSRSPKKGSSFGHILLCYILPFLAVNLAIFFIVTATPKIEMTISDTTDYKTLDVSFKVHSLLPLKKMQRLWSPSQLNSRKKKALSCSPDKQWYSGSLRIKFERYAGPGYRTYCCTGRYTAFL